MLGGSVVNGYNLYCVAGDNGAERWKTSLGATIPQNCMDWDQANGLIVVAGTRNTGWFASPGVAGPGTNKHLWWINGASGAVVFSYDLGAAGIDARGVSVNRAGWCAYVTEYVS